MGKITYAIIVATIDKFKFLLFTPLKTKLYPLFSVLKGSFAELLHKLGLRRFLPHSCDFIAQIIEACSSLNPTLAQRCNEQYKCNLPALRSRNFRQFCGRVVLRRLEDRDPVRCRNPLELKASMDRSPSSQPCR